MDKQELIALALRTEEAIMDGLNKALQAGELHYNMFSPAWDVSCARIVALRAIAEQEGK